MSKTGTAALMGVCLVSGLGGIRQDIMGKDRWLHYMDAAWWPASWTVPLNIVTVLCAVFVLIRAYVAEGKGAER